MFTGIISGLGKIINKQSSFLEIEAPSKLFSSLNKGASIAVNGVCLTVTSKVKDKIIKIDIMPETFRRTSLSLLSNGDHVNLELPATPDSLLSGHIVQGHVDATGRIEEIKKYGNSHIVTISIPKQLNKYIVNKGSIAVNGISLTVIEANLTKFTVGIIPYTWKNTMLHKLKNGSPVNIETDIIAKYVDKLTSN